MIPAYLFLFPPETLNQFDYVSFLYHTETKPGRKIHSRHKSCLKRILSFIDFMIEVRNDYLNLLMDPLVFAKLMGEFKALIFPHCG